MTGPISHKAYSTLISFIAIIDLGCSGEIANRNIVKINIKFTRMEYFRYGPLQENTIANCK